MMTTASDGNSIQLFRPAFSCYDGAASEEVIRSSVACRGNAHHPTRSSGLNVGGLTERLVQHHRPPIDREPPGCWVAWPWPSATPAATSVPSTWSSPRASGSSATSPSRPATACTARRSSTGSSAWPGSGSSTSRTAPSSCTWAARSRSTTRCRSGPATTSRWPTPRASPGSAWRSSDDRERAFALTIKQNTVAVVTDGTAVLGLGDIGPEAALPVMEGKAMLFKEFAGVDAFPICLATKDVGRDRGDGEDDRARRSAAINLEDISAPALLRGRGAAAQGAGHPGLPRRPARHGGRRAGRAAQRAQDRAQGHPADPVVVSGRRRGGHRHHQDPAVRWACARSSASTSTARSTAGRTEGMDFMKTLGGRRTRTPRQRQGRA